MKDTTILINYLCLSVYLVIYPSLFILYASDHNLLKLLPPYSSLRHIHYEINRSSQKKYVNQVQTSVHYCIPAGLLEP